MTFFAAATIITLAGVALVWAFDLGVKRGWWPEDWT